MEKKILVIDDNPDDREIMERFLTKAGFKQLSFAENGLEGAHKARAERPDLIIMDIVMPQKNGPDTAELLRQDSLTSRIPVIFVTSLVRPGESQGGMTRVFAKPFDNSAILNKIQALLKGD